VKDHIIYFYFHFIYFIIIIHKINHLIKFINLKHNIIILEYIFKYKEINLRTRKKSDSQDITLSIYFFVYGQEDM